MPENDKVQHYFFFSLLSVILALNALVFLPYLGPLVFGLTFAVVSAPWHKRIVRLMPNLPNLATFTTMFLVFMVIFVPLTFFGILVFNQAQGLYSHLVNNTDTPKFLAGLSDVIKNEFPATRQVNFLISNLNEYARLFLQYILNNATSVFSGAANLGAHLFLILIALFFFLRDGKSLKKIIMHVSPLRDEDDEVIFSNLDRAVNSVVKGSFLVSLVQGFVASVGFVIFGVPNAALWGAMTFLAAFVPGVGSAMIMIPAAAYLYFTSTPASAAGMALWSIFVGVVDNFVRPKLISGDTGMHPFLIMLSVFGGVSLFGVYGFLIGPLLLSFLFALTQLYKKGIK